MKDGFRRRAVFACGTVLCATLVAVWPLGRADATAGCRTDPLVTLSNSHLHLT